VRAARRFGAPGTVGRSLIVLGRLKRDRGRPELEEAVRLLEGSSARLAYAKALGGLGAGLRRDRKPSEAREPLRRALELADSCGAGALYEEVRSELYATGARPRTTALRRGGAHRQRAPRGGPGRGRPDQPRHRPVALRDPEDGGSDLSNAYRKLGIRHRRELSGVLTAA
jgi:hypothetical protein